MRNLLVFGALAAVAAPAAFAQEASSVTITSNVALVSDYQWRSVTQSDKDWTIQGGFDLTASNGFYAGVWGSGVDFDDEPEDTNLEIDLYGGYRFEAGGLGFDLGLVSYAYPDAGTADLNFYEVYGKVSKSLEGGLSLGGSLNWDPDNQTTYIDGTAGLALNDALSLSGGYGAYIEGYGEYSGWNLGGTYTVSGVALGLRYYDNDTEGDNSNLVFSIGRTM
jgi:uncharacterized protein (TIGR02001 family)